MEPAETYRRRAAEVRALAERLSAGGRIAMMEVAAQWDALAKQAEYLAEVREGLEKIGPTSPLI